MRRFTDRAAAGRELAQRLAPYANRRDAIVLGLARGGVPVGFEVSRALEISLDVLLVRKLGVPGHEELAMGAIAGGGVRIMNRRVLDAVGLQPAALDAVVAREQTELERREQAYRDGRAPPLVEGRVAILVDDGMATGSSIRAAVQVLKRRGAAQIVIAVPVAPLDTCAELEQEVDVVICAHTPEPFNAVAFWYEHFEQTSDDDIRALLGCSGTATSDHARTSASSEA